MHSLRQVFAQGPLGSQLIRTVYGTGYILEAPVRDLEPPSPQSVDPNISTTAPQALAQDDYLMPFSPCDNGIPTSS